MIHQTMLACPVMAVEATGGIDAGANDLLDGDAGDGGRRSGGIVAQGTVVLVQPEDAGPGIGKLGVAGIAVLPLGLVDTDSLADRMDMAVAGKGADVATAAFTRPIDGRTDAAAIDWAVTRGATKDFMHLVWSCADEW